VFTGVKLPYGPGRLETTLVGSAAVGGVRYVEVKRID